MDFKELWSVIGDVHETAVLFTDEGAAKRLKWMQDHSIFERFHGIVELGNYPTGLKCHDQVGVFMITTAIWDEMDAIRAAITSTQCQQGIILSTFPDAALVALAQAEGVALRGDSAFEEFSENLAEDVERPIEIRHLAMHSFNIGQGGAELYLLTDPQLAHCFPLTAAGIADFHEQRLFESYGSTAYVATDQLSEDARKPFRRLAYHLSGVMYDELKLNPVDNLFSCGHTAGLIGHTAMNAIQSNYDADQERQTATLVVLDRSHDLVTAFRHGGSLMAKIFEVIPRTDGNRGADVTVLLPAQVPPLQEPTQLAELAHASPSYWTASGCDNGAEFITSQELQQFVAYPAVSGLAMSVPVSVQVDSADQRASNIAREFATSNEKIAQKVLIQALKDAISENGGALPPQKKRGLGAETLAYLQNVIYSAEDRLSILYKDRNLFQLAMLVVEASQRAATGSPDSGRCTYEQRAQREIQLLKLCHADSDFTTCLVYCIGLLQPTSASCGDLHHVIMLVLIAASTLSASIEGPDCQLLRDAIQEYVWSTASVAELRAFHWLSDDLQYLLVQYRQSGADDGERQQLQFQLEDATSLLVDLIQELSRLQVSMNGIRRPTLVNAEGSLLAHIAECVLDPSKGELNMLKRVQNPLLQIASAGIGLLNAGIGRLGLNVRSSSSPTASAGTSDIMVVFVVGGVTHQDVRMLHQAMRGQPSKRVVIISTCITSPDLLLRDALSVFSNL